jgi:hypothetical protein
MEDCSVADSSPLISGMSISARSGWPSADCTVRRPSVSACASASGRPSDAATATAAIDLALQPGKASCTCGVAAACSAGRGGFIMRSEPVVKSKNHGSSNALR